jgi:hypothetical protein
MGGGKIKNRYNTDKKHILEEDKSFFKRQVHQLITGEFRFKQKIRSQSNILNRTIHSILEVIFLFINPKLVYYFSPNSHKLPSPKQRIQRTDNPLDDIVIMDDGGLKVEISEILMRGLSFDNVGFSPTGKIFGVNSMVMEDDERNCDEAKYYNGNWKLKVFDFPVTYATSGSQIYDYIKNNVPVLYIMRLTPDIMGKPIDMNPELSELAIKYCSKRDDSYVIKMYHKSSCKTLRLGSGLSTILTLAKISKKTTIYGWDLYMTESPKNFSLFHYLKLLLNPYNKAIGDRLFEMTTVYWMYASRLKQLRNINIKGNIKDIDCNKYVKINKIEDIFYQ